MTGDAQDDFRQAVQHFQSGRYLDSERLCLLLLQHYPAHPEFNHVLALSYRAQGKLQDAELAIMRAASNSQDDPAILNSYGLIQMDLGNPSKASQIFAKILVNNPAKIAARTNLGHAQRMLNLTREAEASYREALRLDPNNTDALIQLALLLRSEKRLSELGFALSPPSKEPHPDPGILLVQGLIALDQGRLQDAETAFRHAIKRQPKSALLWTNLGLSLSRQNKFEESQNAYEAAIEIDPRLVEVRINIADLLKYDSPKVARDHLNEAIRIDPKNKFAHDLLGFTQFMDQEYDAAIDCFTHALEIEHDFEQAAAHRAGAYFLKGDLRAAWPDYNRKYGRSGSVGSPVADKLPVWEQCRPTTGPILIWTDQGPGDEILQLGYIADIREKAPALIIATSERLVPIATRSFPDATCVSVSSLQESNSGIGQPVAQCSAMQAAALCWHSFDDRPIRQPYLVADKSSVSQFRGDYRNRGQNRPLVGISWRSTNADFGSKKSLRLTDLIPILACEEAMFVNLQYGETTEEIAELPAEIRRRIICDENVNPLVNMDQFTNQVGALDLVITTSNTTAHVAGALGCRTWTLVPRVGPGWLWYWFDDRTDSPWYPQMRLFRQRQKGNWTYPLAEIQECLSSFLKEFQSLTGN